MRDQADDDQHADRDPHQPDERQARDPRLERADLVAQSPRGGLVGVGPAVLATLEEQGDQHRRPDDRGDEERALGVPRDAVLQDAECDRRRRHRRQMPEPTDDQRSQCLHQCDDAERLADRHADDPGPQEQREEREPGGDGPHERGQPGDGDAEHLRPFALLGRTADRRTEASAPEEEGDGDHGDRCHDQGDQVVRREDERADRQLPVERRWNSLRRDGLAPHAWHEQGEHGEELGDADRRDGQNESRCLGESSDERELDDGTECDRRRDADAEAGRYGQAGEQDQADGERRRDEAEVGLGEVDDPVGSVDQRHAHRQQRREESEDHASDPRTHRHAEPDELYGDQCDGRREWTDDSPVAI